MRKSRNRENHYKRTLRLFNNKYDIKYNIVNSFKGLSKKSLLIAILNSKSINRNIKFFHVILHRQRFFNLFLIFSYNPQLVINLHRLFYINLFDFFFTLNSLIWLFKITYIFSLLYFNCFSRLFIFLLIMRFLNYRIRNPLFEAIKKRKRDQNVNNKKTHIEKTDYNASQD